MIPEQYWRILRRWFWLIGGIAIGCAVLAAVTLPSLLSSSSGGYSAAVTLGVTRMVSFGGTTAAGQGDPQLLASYTDSIAERGSSPQYLSNLETALAAKGVTLPDGKLERSLRFTSNPGLFRVEIEATAAVPNDAKVIAETAAEQLITDTKAEEGRIVAELTTTSAQQEAQLRARLNEVYQARIDRMNTLGEPALRAALDELVRRGIGADLNAAFSTLVQDLARISADPDLSVLNSEAASLEAQLAELSESQRNYSAELLQGNPVSTVTPVETVPLAPATALRARDTAVMGLIVGAVIGWIAANTAESMQLNTKMKKRREEEWDTSLSGVSGSIFSDD
jgi:hypothetical protein